LDGSPPASLTANPSLNYKGKSSRQEGIAIDELKERELRVLIEETLKEIEKMVHGAIPATSAPAGTPQNHRKQPVPGYIEDGVAWVEEGRLCVRNPRGGGKFPVIVPGPGTRLIVNNVPTTAPATVSEEDIIHVETLEEPIPAKIEVTITPDRLHAYLTIQLPGVKRYRLVDQPPSTYLQLQTEHEITKEATLDETQIKKILAKNKVLFGLKPEVLSDLLRHPRDGKFLVAEGIPPVSPTDEQIQLFFTPEPDLRPKVNPDGSVDFREINAFPSVNAGTILAAKTPGSPGKPGRGVDARPIAPPEQRTIVLHAGPGAALTKNGTNMVATRNGRPCLKSTGNTYSFTVEPVLVHHGNVDLSTGNIRFQGKVEITGNVSEGMKVYAAGGIEIFGLVSQATLSALGNIAIYNGVIGSVLNAGSGTRYIKEYVSLLEKMGRKITEFLATAKALTEHPKLRQTPVQIGYLLLLLREHKFSELCTWANNLRQLNMILAEPGVELPPNSRAASDRLLRLFSGFYLSEVRDLTEVQQAIHDALFLRQEVTKLSLHKTAHLIVHHTVNAKLIATGNVLVTGEGCYNTQIYAGGSVTVAGRFRGGEINARGNVTVGAAGSPHGISTKIRTAANATVYLREAHEGVIIQIGRAATEIKTRMSRIRLSLNREGRIDRFTFPTRRS
jgi:uncharacterized protein (DUF342 family)